MTVSEIGRALRARKMSVREAVGEALRRAAESQDRLNAFITITHDEAMARAAELDAMLERGVDLGPWHGVPIAHKDCIYTKGVRTTGGSKIFADFVPRRDADLVTQMHKAGAVSIGKTNLHELTYGITSINPWFGSVRNPHDPERVAGGSSGGSGAAVAAGIVPLATGTDTGGSIRIPASFCGCVGFKPTFRSLPRRGIMALSYTQDHPGYLAGCVEDLCLPIPRDAHYRVGVWGTDLEGATPVDLPFLDEAVDIGRVTLLAEATDALGRWSDHAGDYGADVWALLEEGRKISAETYIATQRRRAKLAREAARIFEHVDCVVLPTTPFPAFPIEHEGSLRPAATRYTRPFNVLGWPALALPYGTPPEGLPLSLQVVAAPGREDIVLAVGARIEKLASSSTPADSSTSTQ